MTLLDELQRLIGRHSAGARTETAIAGVVLFRSATVAAAPMNALYTPMLCVIAQGRKRVLLGSEAFEYDAAKYLISSVDLPVTGSVLEATEERPYLSMSVSLLPEVLSSLLLDLPGEARSTAVPRGLAVTPLPPELLEATVRLLRLLDRPAEIRPLAPLIMREIFYRLLTGEHAAMLRQIAVRESRTQQVMRAIQSIRDNYAKPFRMTDLMRVAHMSAPSLYRHFKAVTAMSPLQYQKQIRLTEARRILLSEQQDAATAGFSVGYGSPSQFSREYGRQFGVPPRQDARKQEGDDARGRVGSATAGLRLRRRTALETPGCAG